MGKHSDPNEKKLGKYFALGLAALVLIGGAGYGVTRLNQTATPKKAAVEKTTTSRTKTATSKTPATDQSSTKKTEKTKETTHKKQQKKATSKKVSFDDKDLRQSAGKVYYGVHYFDENQDFSSENSEATSAAHVIELFIMDYALAKNSGTDVIAGKPLNEWLIPMIQQNDLTVTNTLIDYYGMAPLNAYFQEQGYKDTRIERRMLDMSVLSNDQDNYTSLNDCLKLLKKLYQGRTESPQKQMLELLEHQQDQTKIPAKLSSDYTVAHLAGQQQQVENDIGIVFDKQHPFALVVLTDDVTDITNVRTAIAEFSLAATKWE